MTKKHDEIFDDVLSGLGANSKKSGKGRADRSGSRFLTRSNALGEKLSGEYSEKTLQWVDPARCRMWSEHNREYGLLTPENCSDLIEGLRAQGQQEFPAIVRKLEGEENYDFEVICGARRHFAVSWLRANNYPQFKYLIEVRDLSDEEAFRLADIENRDRQDISDLERASDYARAIARYYGGKQKTMAERLQVSEGWLSRYLYLARLPKEIIDAYPDSRDIKEHHARALKPYLANTQGREALIERAIWLRDMRTAGSTDHGQPWNEATKVLAELKRAGQGLEPKRKPQPMLDHTYSAKGTKCTMKRKDVGKSIHLEIPRNIENSDLRKLMEKLYADLDASVRQ